MEEKLNHDKWAIWLLDRKPTDLLVLGGIWVELCLKTLQVSKELNKMIVFSDVILAFRMYIAKSCFS